MQDEKKFSINTLINCFQKALRAIVPIADELNLPWKEPDNYDDWDVAAQGIFNGFVLVGIRSSHEWSADYLPFVEYDHRNSEYAFHSYISVQWNNKSYPLICLETDSKPFDTCLLAEIDKGEKFLGTIRAPFDACNFSAVIKKQSEIIEIDSISF